MLQSNVGASIRKREACKELHKGGIIPHPYIPGVYQRRRRDHHVGGGEGKNQGRMGNQGTFDTVPYGLRVDAVAVECRDISTMRVAGIPRRRLVA